MTPAISVIVPLFNGMPYLVEQLDAMLAQQFNGLWELIYVDNGSTDGSINAVQEAIRRNPGHCIRLIDGGRRGQVFARNLGAAHASAEWLAFTDQDDIPDRLWLGCLTKALAGYDAVGGFVEVTRQGHAPSPRSGPANLNRAESG